MTNTADISNPTAVTTHKGDTDNLSFSLMFDNLIGRYHEVQGFECDSN
jgi:hypothetical protein